MELKWKSNDNGETQLVDSYTEEEYGCVTSFDGLHTASVARRTAAVRNKDFRSPADAMKQLVYWARKDGHTVT